MIELLCVTTAPPSPDHRGGAECDAGQQPGRREAKEAGHSGQTREHQGLLRECHQGRRAGQSILTYLDYCYLISNFTKNLNFLQKNWRGREQ